MAVFDHYIRPLIHMAHSVLCEGVGLIRSYSRVNVLVFIFGIISSGACVAGSDHNCGQSSASDNQIFFDGFSGGAIDTCQWRILNEAWGPNDNNGGVIPANVAVSNGRAVLTALGNLYSGPLRGIDSKGRVRPTGQRAGAAVMTQRKFRGGRFEVRMKIIPELGVCTAVWTYFNTKGPDGKVLNHEIDIELPGVAEDGTPSLNWVSLTSWIGLGKGQKSTKSVPLPPSHDGFRLFRFDWWPQKVELTSGSQASERIEFYIDGKLVHTTHQAVPNLSAPLFIGAWFPRAWAGQPNFAKEELIVDWVRVTPLVQ